MNKWVLIACTLGLLLRTVPSSAQQSSDGPSQEQRISAIKQKAESGEAKAQVALGIAYASGDGIQADEGEAVRWFRRAAEQNDAVGEYSLGEMYAFGRGVPVDYTEAAKWLRKSAEQGDSRAESNLAVLYAKGQGVPKDDTEAAKWMRKAAEQGSAEGQFGLGVMYAHGRGVPPDNTEAVKWYRKAMEQGDGPAMNNLAFLLATSKDVHVRNPNEAIAVALKAVDLNPQQPSYLDTLATAYYEAGRNEEAADTESKALALSPDNASYKNALEKYRASATKR
jgi:TPR repeat protein